MYDTKPMSALTSPQSYPSYAAEHPHLEPANIAPFLQTVPNPMEEPGEEEK